MLSYDFIINTFKKRGADKYIVITKFSPSDSKLISDALIDSNSSVYFSDKGSIDVVTPTVTKTFGNPLTGYNRSNSTNIELKIKTIPSTQKYVFSKLLGFYVLYIASANNVSLRYNPMPRPEIVQFYKEDKSAAKGLILNACMETNGLDPVCSCINRNEETTGSDTEFCMNELFGSDTVRKAIKKADRKNYDEIAGWCFCSNTKCQQDHPVVKYIIKEEKGECPKNLVITMCNSTINAGRDLKAQDINLQQNCGASSTTQTATQQVPPPVESPPVPAPSQPVTGSTYTSDKPPTTTVATTPQATQPTKVKQIQAPPKQKDNTIYIIIAIVLLIILVAAYFLLK